MKLIILIALLSISSLHAIEGKYLFSLESMSQAQIDAIPLADKVAGMMIFNTTDKKVYDYNGADWVCLNTPPSVITKTGNYTLTAVDNGSIFRFDSVTDMNLTVPIGLVVSYNVSVYQVGTGKVTIIGGATIKNRLSRFKTAGLDAGVGIVSTATDIFHITGDLKK